jgi:hypothetical protein
MNLQAPLTKLLAVTTATMMLFTGCSSESGGSDDGPSPNQAAPEAHAYNDAELRSTESMQDFGQAIDGPGGVYEIAGSLEALDLDDPSDRARLADMLASLDEKMLEAEDELGQALLAALEMADHETALQELRNEALAGFGVTFEARPKFIGVTTVLAAVTLGVTLTTVYRKLRDVTHKNQNRPVRNVATGSEGGKQTIINALESRGVSVPPGATGEQVADIFEAQTERYTRAHVARAAIDFGVDKAGENTPEGDAAQDQLEDHRDQTAEASKELGIVATDAVVNLSPAGPTGLGPGVEATMLVLTLTENTPNDIVNRHVDAVVASKEQTNIPETQPTSVTPEDARQRLQDSIDDEDESPTPDEVEELSDAIIDGLREQAEAAGGISSIPQRVAFGTSTLEPTGTGTGPNTANLEIRGFSPGEAADVLVVRPDAAPQEATNHALSETNPLELETTPLLGTLTLSASPDGPAVDGERTWTAQADIRRAYNPTHLAFDGVNVSITPSTISVGGGSGSESHTVSVDAFGDANLRVRRLDTGESYLIALSSEDAQDQCPGIGTFVCDDGEVICADIVCNGSADCADGSDENNEMCGDDVSCCVATQGCPGETGSDCADTCCCCPYGMVCDRNDFTNGCIPE